MVDVERFRKAVRAGDMKLIDELIAAGADVNAALPDDEPPLHIAIEHQLLDVVRRLIAGGADLNQDIGNGWTPLAHSIDIESDGAWQAHYERGHETTELTELLLSAGAIPTPRAFRVAENYGNEKALALLNRYASRS